MRVRVGRAVATYQGGPVHHLNLICFVGRTRFGWGGSVMEGGIDGREAVCAVATGDPGVWKDMGAGGRDEGGEDEGEGADEE